VRLYLKPVRAQERPTVRALGARFDARVDRWWVDPEWGDIRRFDRWLPADALIADVQRNLDDIRYGEP
jgi:Domain of unknown function (DUF5710)